MKKSLLHTVIGTDLLQDIPRKFLIEFPGAHAHSKSGDANDRGDGIEKGRAASPYRFTCAVQKNGPVFVSELINGSINLVDLENGVDEESQVGDAKPDNLNGVLPAQGIPREKEDIEEAEDEQSQERRYRHVLGFLLLVIPVTRIFVDAALKFAENVSAASQFSATTSAKEQKVTHASKVTPMMACKATMEKKILAHLDSRKSNPPFLGREAASEAMKLSRNCAALSDPSKLRIGCEPAK